MSENAFYPTFLLAAWTLVRALETPTLARQAVLLGACGVAVLVRVQAARARARGPDGAAPPLARSRADRCARSCRSTLSSPAVRCSRSGRSSPAAPRSTSLLGAYAVVGEERLRPRRGAALPLLARRRARPLRRHLPGRRVHPPRRSALARSMRGRRSSSSPPSRSASWTLLVVAAFASRFAGAIEERNMFVVAPLLLIALLVWIDRGARRPTFLAVIAAAVAAAPPRADPLRALPPAQGALGHADDRPALERAGLGHAAAPRRRCARRRARRRARSSCSCPARWALVLPAARARLLRARDPADPGRPARDGARGRGRALRGDPRPATRLDRRVGSRRSRGCRRSGPGRRTASRSTRTSSSAAGRAGLHARRPACPAASRRRS